MENATHADRLRLREMIEGYQLSQAIAVAAQLGIADHLALDPKTHEQLARITGAEPAALLRLLRALASKGIFVEVSETLFGLTPLAAILQSDEPRSLKSSAIQVGQPYMWAAWGQFLHSIKTGAPAFKEANEIGVWEYRAQHAEAGAAFDSAMDEGARHVAASIAIACETNHVGTVVDVGGGTGALLVTMLKANPKLRGVLFDQPQVVARANERLKGTDVVDRCSVVAGDFFSSVPASGDLYILKGIIHDWDDCNARRILMNCYRAMGPGSRLLLVEQLLLSDGIMDSFGFFMDLHMLTIHGAQERTQHDYTRLLGAAGFNLARILPTEAGLYLIEATPGSPADDT